MMRNFTKLAHPALQWKDVKGSDGVGRFGRHT